MYLAVTVLYMTVAVLYVSASVLYLAVTVIYAPLIQVNEDHPEYIPLCTARALTFLD